MFANALQTPAVDVINRPSRLWRAAASAPLWSVHRSRPMVAKMKTFADFEALEDELRGYLATLNSTALNDPAAPSPLAYIELNNAGRSDLANGIMSFGGYIEVSQRLGVRLKAVAAVPVVENPWVQPPAETDLAGAGVVLSASAKEEKMAADLERLASGMSPLVSGGGGQSEAAATRDRLSPLTLRNAASDAADGRSPQEEGGGRYVMLDGLQRANALLLVGLLAVGFGRTSAQSLDEQTVGAVQLAFCVLAVAHLVIACWGAFLASRSAEASESAPLWFAKLTVSGLGGLLELNRRLERRI